MSHATKPHDDENISDDDYFLRGISSEFIVKDPKSPSGNRLSTASMNPSSSDNGLSGWLRSDLTIRENYSLSQAPAYQGIIKLPVSLLREIEKPKLRIGRDPNPLDRFHCQVWGTGKFPNSIKKKLLRNSKWFKPIEGVEIYQT